MNERRRAEDEAFTPGGIARVLTLKQFSVILGLVLTIVTLLQTVGLKFLADSYIDQRIKIHNVDPRAHEGAIAMAVQDSDRLHVSLEELKREIGDATKAMNNTNERLARIEGALAARR
jgi:hypothetical protein